LYLEAGQDEGETPSGRNIGWRGGKGQDFTTQRKKRESKEDFIHSQGGRTPSHTKGEENTEAQKGHWRTRQGDYEKRIETHRGGDFVRRGQLDREKHQKNSLNSKCGPSSETQ